MHVETPYVSRVKNRNYERTRHRKVKNSVILLVDDGNEYEEQIIKGLCFLISWRN